MSYYLDRGIWFFGSHVESEVDQAGENASRGAKNKKSREALANGARNRMLDKLLGGNDRGRGQFKDAAAAVRVSS